MKENLIKVLTVVRLLMSLGHYNKLGCTFIYKQAEPECDYGQELASRLPRMV